MYWWGGDTLGEPRFEFGAERMLRGGGIIWWSCGLGRGTESWCRICLAALVAWPRERRELGLLWMRRWGVSPSEGLKRFEHPGWVQAWGFSPVWVRMWRVWCSRRWKALEQMGHL